MPTKPSKSPAIYTNKDTRTWVQSEGVGEEFDFFGCAAITTWSRDYGETTYVKCKSADEYGKKDIKESIPGDPSEPTFTVVAFTPADEDFLLELDCPVDFQEHFGACSSPSDATGYSKIRHFYRASKTSESESNIDFIGDEEYAALEQSVEFTCEEIVTVLQTVVTQANNGVTEAQAFNDIAMLRTARCEGDCGREIKPCWWGLAVADSNYGVATANAWYTDDGGATWTVCAVDPFTATDADISSCVILTGETAPRFIVFRGNVSGIYGCRASISDDWGATWTEVDVGGTLNGNYINGAWAYSAGLIWIVGNGIAFYSEDQGESWTEIAAATLGTSVELWDVHSPDGDTVYICGSDNTVIKSVDAGESWTAMTSPADALEDLYTIQAPTKYRVIVGGERDASEECLWISQDGATTWTASAFNGSTTASEQVRRVRLADKAIQNHYVMIAGVNNGATKRYGPGTSFYFFRTLNGGGSWERDNLQANNGLNGLSVCTINKAWAAGETVGGIGEIQKMYPS